MPLIQQHIEVDLWPRYWARFNVPLDTV